MPQSFFKLDKAWFEDFAISDSGVLKIYDGGDYIIAAVRNYPFYLHGRNPACFPVSSRLKYKEVLIMQENERMYMYREDAQKFVDEHPGAILNRYSWEVQIEK